MILIINCTVFVFTLLILIFIFNLKKMVL